MSRRLLVVADAHLGSRPGDVEEFLAFLDANSTNLTDLVLLGDLFDLWIGFEELQGDHQMRVLAALRGLRGSGVRLRYVEGNRDFYIAHAFRPHPFEEVAGDRLWLTIAGNRLCFEHGDLVNTRDRNYLCWRRFARRGWVRACVSRLPARITARLASGLERRLRTTNLEHRAGFPEDLCRIRVSSALASGAQRHFIGHFHRLWEWREERGGRAIRATVVPAWQRDRVGWIYDPERGVDQLSGPMPAGSISP